MSIPKIIHQIWIGETEITNSWLKDCDGVKNQHPDWEYKLWKNVDAEEILKNATQNIKSAYMRYWKEKHWSNASDILRYLVLYEHGGVYMDCDFIMNKHGSLNQLPLEKNLILLNMLHSSKETPKLRLQSCFMAAAPKNKFMQRVLDGIDNTDYTLTTKRGVPCDKYNTQYLTTEYNIHLGLKFFQKKGLHKITEDLSNIIPPDEAIVPKNYFIGREAIIAQHLYKNTHKKKLISKFINCK